MDKINDRRKRKRLYFIASKWMEEFEKYPDTDLSKDNVDIMEKIFEMEIKSDILLDKTHEWRKKL